MKKAFAFITVCVLAFTCLTACSGSGNTETTGEAGTTGTAGATGTTAAPASDSSSDEYFSNYDLTEDYDEASAVSVTLNGDNASASSEGITINGQHISITSAGTYIFTGTLTDGSITVNVGKQDKVHLVLNGADITCTNSAPLYVAGADKVLITLKNGTANKLTDATSYVFADGEDKPNACLYSSDDLTINGSGSLTVSALFNNGIGCKNDLRIVNGTINVNAVNNGIKGNGSVSVKGGTITVTGSDDGIKSDSTDEGKGFIYICGGTISVTASDDALQAQQSINVTAGLINTYAGGNDVNCDGTVTVADGCLIKN